MKVTPIIRHEPAPPPPPPKRLVAVDLEVYEAERLVIVLDCWLSEEGCGARGSSPCNQCETARELRDELERIVRAEVKP